MSISLLLTTAHAAHAFGQNAEPVIPWVRIVVAFLICIFFAVGAILWLRARQGVPVNVRKLFDRIGRNAPLEFSEPFEVERRLRVSPTGQMIILRCGDRRYLIHAGPHGAQNLDRLDDAPALIEPLQ